MDERPFPYQVWLTTENRLLFVTFVDQAGAFINGFTFATRACMKINDERIFRRDELKRRANKNERDRFFHALSEWGRTPEECEKPSSKMRR